MKGHFGTHFEPPLCTMWHELAQQLEYIFQALGSSVKILMLKGNWIPWYGLLRVHTYPTVSTCSRKNYVARSGSL
jgi:hypothetical protein